MPSHQRLGPDGRHRLHDRWKPPIQLQEEQAIAVRELDPTAHLALKHNQLTSERGILSLKPADRPERRNQQPQKEEAERDHPGRRYVILLPDQTDDVFGTHNLWLPRTQIRAYRWCSPPRIGCAIMSPNRSIGRVQGASLLSERCVRTSL